MKATYEALIAHCGGADAITVTKDMQARRCACLDTELTFMEAKFAASVPKAMSRPWPTLTPMLVSAGIFVAWQSRWDGRGRVVM
jgi:hypothetical protein